jgi:hypothetical protein
LRKSLRFKIACFAEARDLEAYFKLKCSVEARDLEAYFKLKCSVEARDVEAGVQRCGFLEACKVEPCPTYRPSCEAKVGIEKRLVRRQPAATALPERAPE